MSGKPNASGVNINVVTTGGVTNTPIMFNNDCQGLVKSVMDYTGPPPETRSQQKRQTDGGSSLTIVNEGGVSNAPIMSGNRFGGGLDTVFTVKAATHSPASDTTGKEIKQEERNEVEDMET